MARRTLFAAGGVAIAIGTSIGYNKLRYSTGKSKIEAIETLPGDHTLVRFADNMEFVAVAAADTAFYRRAQETGDTVPYRADRLSSKIEGYMQGGRPKGAR